MALQIPSLILYAPAIIIIVILFSQTSLGNPVSSVTPATVDPPKCPIHGHKFFPNPDYCTKYYMCSHGVPVEHNCPGKLVFNDELNVCVEPGSAMDKCTPANVYRECKRKTVTLIPHPTECQGYYNCSDPVSIHRGSAFSNIYQKECSYPKQFDINLKRCVKFDDAVCGKGRLPAIWYCDYESNRCHTGSCQPCRIDHPSCVGKEDGLWPIPEMVYTEYYNECRSQRSVHGREKCPDMKIFDPIKRKCGETGYGKELHFVAE